MFSLRSRASSARSVSDNPSGSSARARASRSVSTEPGQGHSSTLRCRNGVATMSASLRSTHLNFKSRHCNSRMRPRETPRLAGCNPRVGPGSLHVDCTARRARPAKPLPRGSRTTWAGTHARPISARLVVNLGHVGANFLARHSAQFGHGAPVIGICDLGRSCQFDDDDRWARGRCGNATGVFAHHKEGPRR
jgi:hypothetical protein